MSNWNTRFRYIELVLIFLIGAAIFNMAFTSLSAALALTMVTEVNLGIAVISMAGAGMGFLLLFVATISYAASYGDNDDD